LRAQAHWQQEEQGIVISHVAIWSQRRCFEQRARDVAIIGIHALARWCQRSGSTLEADLLADLKLLIAAAKDQAKVHL
jgi:hypothetical protein